MPSSPFGHDPTPFATHNAGSGIVRMGSYYGEAGPPFARTPARSFTTADSGLSPFGAHWAHLVVLPVTGDTYLVVVCSVDPTPPAPQYCTVSGTGEFARFTGLAYYQYAAWIKLVMHVYATW